MANPRKLGFLPTRMTSGGTITFRRGRVLTNNTVAINFNDSIKRAATGDYVACTAGADESILLSSVAQGVVYTRADGTKIEAKNLPAATLYTSTGVWPDNGSYVAMVDQATLVEYEANMANAVVVMTDFNLNFPAVLTASATGFSKHEVNHTTGVVTATVPWRLREYVQRADNDLSLVDCKCLFMINAGQDEPAVSLSTGT